MELYQINTSAYSEEDMLIISDATIDEIESVIQPMVHQERHADAWHDHADYLNALCEAFSHRQFIHIQEPTNLIF